MVATCLRGVIHNMPFPLPRTIGMVTHSVAYAFGATGRGESHIVFLLTLGILPSPEPWALLIVFHLGMLDDVS